MLSWTLAQTLPNIRRDDTRLMVSVDFDDPQSLDVALAFAERDARVRPCNQPREDSVGRKFNRALLLPADVYLSMVDYVPHITPGFDEKILEAASLFPDGIGVVYNHMANASFPGIQAVTQGWVDRMGWIFPEYFPYWFIDHWVDDVAKMIGRISFADVQVATATNRSTHEFREPYFWATFFDACGLLRRRQARQIIDSPDFFEDEWRKEILRRSFPLVEHRSQWVNEQVRAMQVPIDHNRASGGDRYERLRAKATEMLKHLVADLESDHQQKEEMLSAA